MADTIRPHRPRLRARRLCRGDPGEPARPQGGDRRAGEAGRHLPQLGVHPDQGAAADARDLPLSDPRLRLRPQRREGRLRPGEDRRPQPQGRRPAQRGRQGADEEEQDRRSSRATASSPARASSPSPRMGKTTELSAKHIIVATGARARDLPFAKADGERIWTYRHAMVPKEMPTKLLVIGSGAIGVEFASFYSDMGAEVTIVEMLDRDPPGRGRGRLRLRPQGAGQAGDEDPRLVRRREARDRPERREGRSEGRRQSQEFSHAIVAIGIVPTPRISASRRWA